MTDIAPDADLDAVFSIVANDTRLEILRALWETHTENPEEIEGPEREPVPFSVLRERVGVRDSGRFNYHLDELVPQFVQDRDDGYALTYAGASVIGAAVSGVYTGVGAELDALSMGECAEQDCEGRLEATYQNGHIRVNCDTCDAHLVMHAPPILVEAHDLERDSGTIQQYTLTEMQKTVRGFCPLCNGPVAARVARSSLGDSSDGQVQIVHECRECGTISHTTAGVFVLDHPAVVSLLHEAGIDYRHVALWERPRVFEYGETVRSQDPVRVEVTATVEGRTLTLVLDETLDVIEYSRDN